MNKVLNILLLSFAAVLFPAPFLGAQESTVADSLQAEKLYLPIGRTGSRYQTTGTARSWSGKTLEKYPGGDVKNSMTGVIPGLFVTETTGATGVLYGQPNCDFHIRGFSPKVIIVDDVADPKWGCKKWSNTITQFSSSLDYQEYPGSLGNVSYMNYNNKYYVKPNRNIPSEEDDYDIYCSADGACRGGYECLVFNCYPDNPYGNSLPSNTVCGNYTK